MEGSLIHEAASAPSRVLVSFEEIEPRRAV